MTRPPLATIEMFSEAFEPLNSIVSTPAWPSSVSLSSPGFQTKTSSPAPISAISSPSPPLIRSSPSEPRKMSSPSPPFMVSWMAPASRLVASITSSPPRPLRTSRSLAASGKKMFTAAPRPNTLTPPASPATPNTSAPCVALTVTVSAAPSPLPPGPRRSRSIFVISVPERSPITMLSAPPSARKSIVSTSSRSIVTLAMSRKKLTRPPFAEMVMFSAMFAPKNSIVSVPFCPSMVSLPSPGFHWNTSSSAPRKATSLPLSPKTKSSPLPPRNTSAPWLPSTVSSPAPASIVSLITPAGSVVAVMPSSPPSALITSESFAPSELVMLVSAARPITDTLEPAPTMSMMSPVLVPLVITTSAAPSPAVPPIVPARSTSTSTTSVPLMSLTVIVSVPPSAFTVSVSTSSRSITMLPRLRVKSARLPFADAAMISLPPLPLNSIVSVPSCPSTTSLPSPGSHWNTSLPLPRKATSLPC